MLTKRCVYESYKKQTTDSGVISRRKNGKWEDDALDSIERTGLEDIRSKGEKCGELGN